MAPQPGEIQQQNPPPAVERAGERVTAAPETTLKLAGESDTDTVKRQDNQYREATKPHTDRGNQQVAAWVKTGQSVGLKVT